MNWETIQKDILYWDGSWRDIYFKNTEAQTWDKFLEFISGSGVKFELVLDGTGSEIIPYSQIKARDSKALKIWVDHVQLSCHFFCDDEIEMDIDPREINNLQTWINVLNFLKGLSQHIDRAGIITPENMDSVVLQRIE